MLYPLSSYLPRKGIVGELLSPTRAKSNQSFFLHCMLDGFEVIGALLFAEIDADGCWHASMLHLLSLVRASR